MPVGVPAVPTFSFVYLLTCWETYGQRKAAQVRIG